MANSDNSYTKIYAWEIGNVLSLQQETGNYEQSEIFSSKGPIGQDIKWVLRLYPRGIKKKSNKNVSVYLHLIDGNGSKEVKVDWRLAIINGKGVKVNKKQDNLCDYYLETMDQGWGFDDFISRAKLDDKNFIVEGHKLILHSEIIIKKDLQAVELMQEKEKTKNLKRKLDAKENDIQKIRSDYEEYRNGCRAELGKIGDMIKRFKKEEEARDSKLSDYEQQFKSFREKIANAEKEKLAAIEKCRKDDEKRLNQLRTDYEQQLKCLQENYTNAEKNRLAVIEKYHKEEEANSKLRTEEFDRNQKNHRDEIAQLKQIHFTEIEKLLKEEEARSNQLRWEYEIQLNRRQKIIANLTNEKAALDKSLKDEEESHSIVQKQLNKEKYDALEQYEKEKKRSKQMCFEYKQQFNCLGAEIANLEKEKEALKKCLKDGEERSNQLRSDYELQLKHYREQNEKIEKEKLAAQENLNKLQEKYGELFNHYKQNVLENSKFIAEHENDSKKSTEEIENIHDESVESSTIQNESI